MGEQVEPDVGAPSVFSKWASRYDRSRRQLIPCFDDFYAAAVEALPFAATDQIDVLDLGAGTGLLSAFVRERFPHAHLTLLDASREMLDIARDRFRSASDRIEYVVGDYARELPEGEFHAVVSAVSIHHLDEEAKKALWREIFRIVRPGGIFVNADQVLGRTAEEEKFFREAWLNEVRECGVSAADLAGALERMREDKLSTLEVQLAGLGAAGFERVGCVFQEKSFAVFAGRKGD
jgi:tRNA (cmo5U34)-methyltransferase